jgi:hypothetical protein
MGGSGSLPCAENPPAAVAAGGETWRMGGSGSLPCAENPPAAVAAGGEARRLGGSGSLPCAQTPPAAVAADGETWWLRGWAGVADRGPVGSGRKMPGRFPSEVLDWFAARGEQVDHAVGGLVVCARVDVRCCNHHVSFVG